MARLYVDIDAVRTLILLSCYSIFLMYVDCDGASQFRTFNDLCEPLAREVLCSKVYRFALPSGKFGG